MVTIPERIQNFVGHTLLGSETEGGVEKFSPMTGKKMFSSVDSTPGDLEIAIQKAKFAFKEWSRTPAVKRGDVLFKTANLMETKTDDLVEIIHLETGKSRKDARGEVGAAISQCRFMAGEGQRLFGRTSTSTVAGRLPMIIREPIGVVGLIAASNTPIANVAWKAFPAIVCGNTALFKPSEDTPWIANAVGELLAEAGLPAGVFNVVHGAGRSVGTGIVGHKDIAMVSFTGSSATGMAIAQAVGQRMGRVSLELGGKNPFIVFNDADIDNAVKWGLLSAFSNAGQRCAAASRFLVQDGCYSEFKRKFVEGARALKIGSADSDDFGPVINRRQFNGILDACTSTAARGVSNLLGAEFKVAGTEGFYLKPSIFESVATEDPFFQNELFGPAVCLNSFSRLDEVVELANSTQYGLTAAVHTTNYKTAMEICRDIESGLVQINAGTYGSEPHMPFGGVKMSGNGTREPGPEAIDVYSNMKTIIHNF